MGGGDKKKTADLAISGLGGIQRFRWVGRSGENVQGATVIYGCPNGAGQGLNCGKNVICSDLIYVGPIYITCATRGPARQAGVRCTIIPIGFRDVCR